MRLRRVSALPLLLLLFIGAAHQASAWDDTGHMQVADIAWIQLTPRAKTEVTAILMGGESRFRPVSDREEDVRDAFRKAATFPDYIKGRRDTAYESILPEMNRRFFVTHPPDPNNNEDVLCKTWHYYDTPIRDRGRHTAEESNARKALTLARQELTRLQGMPSHDRKMEAWWVYWIEHIVGDLHQPLHCASSYEFATRTGDAGGNKFLIVPFPDQPDNKTRLHAFWDGTIGRAIGQERTQGLAPDVESVTGRWVHDHSLAPSRSEANNLNVAAWTDRGAQLADRIIYTGIAPDTTPSASYVEAQIKLCKQQAVLAGTHLAKILNAALGR